MDAEDRMLYRLHFIESTAQRGTHHGARIAELHPLTFTIGAAGPAGVHEPHDHVVLRDVVAEHLRVDGRFSRHERSTEARAEGGLRLGDSALGSGDLGGVAREEMVHRLLRGELGDWRQHAERIRGEHENLLGVPAGAACGDVRDMANRVRGARVLGEYVAIQIQTATLRIEDDVFEDRAEHPCGLVDLGLALLRQTDHFCVASPFEIEDSFVAPAVLVVADELSLRVGRQRRLPRSRKPEEDSQVVLVLPVVRRTVHRQHVFRRQHVGHDGKDRLLDLPRVVGSANDDFTFVEVEDDEHLGAGAVLFGNGVEQRCIDHGELRHVGFELFVIVLANEHVTRKQVVPRACVHHSNGNLVVGMCARVAVLDEEVSSLKICGEPRFQLLVVLGLERLRRIPPDIVLAPGLADDVLVVGRASRVLAGTDHERTPMGDEPLAPLNRMLVERGRGQVPPHGIRVDDSMMLETVMTSGFSLCFHTTQFPSNVFLRSYSSIFIQQ